MPCFMGTNLSSWFYLAKAKIKMSLSAFSTRLRGGANLKG